MKASSSPNTPPSDVARLIYGDFRSYRDAFNQITAEAPSRFTCADWAGGQRADEQRLAAYHTHVVQASERLPGIDHSTASENSGEFTEWAKAKRCYTTLINDTQDPELAESFFNSVYRNYTLNGTVDASQMYLYPSDAKTTKHPTGITETFAVEQGIGELIRDVLQSFEFELPWQDIDRDVANILRSLTDARQEIEQNDQLSVEVVTTPFYRNKGAYVIGRLHLAGQTWPLAIPILQSQDQRLRVDALICDEDELSVMFSFTRAYFMVAVPQPSALISFLKALLPNKKLSELYASIGLHKHGKTTFYRGFLSHLGTSDDKFIIAPGIKGMVMAVFTLPSYQTVFKVIKDRFAPQKRVTPAQVKEKYHIVKTHDRVGRMADTQEFQNFSFPKARFTQNLLDELRAVCASSIIEEGDQIIIRHLYTERHMTPLNMYVETCEEEDLENALDEYGNAIKQLAAANIFPGDMLLKNFGITRHGRVVFYDYDEIEYLTDMRFLDDPEASSALADTPANTRLPEDPLVAYPKNFRQFLFSKRDIESHFMTLHGELFEAAYWRELQASINAGQISDVFPYRRKKRFATQQVSPR